MALSLTAAELLSLPPTTPSTWVVEGLLRTQRKRPSLLCGLPEAGKSTLALQLALAVGNGVHFLELQTKHGHVIYWKNEDSAQDILEDARQAGMTAETKISFILPSPGDNNYHAMHQELEKHPDTLLVIIEVLADFLEMDDITSNDDSRRALKEFMDSLVIAHPDCAFLLLHHFSKSVDDSELSVKKIMGGTAIPGGTDAKIYLYRISDGDPRRVIHATVRKGRGIEPTYLDFDPATLTSSLGTTVKAEAIATRKAAKLQKGVDLDAKIMQTIKENPGMAKWDLVALVGGNTQATGKRIDELIVAKLIAERQGGDKGTARLLYAAGQEEQQANFSEANVAAG